MRGHDVLHPFGWDAFGLPAENAAITRGIHPGEWTTKNIETSRNTLRQMGLSYDWEREVVTCRADYYKFTQWMFLLLHRRGLAYRARAAVNWCPVDQTVLANEHVVDGCCWRHPGVPVEKRELEQWFFRITEYAQRLLDDLDKLPDWPESTVKMQRSWIGRSEGAEVTFHVPGWATASGHGEGITVFTTRPDTLWGATFLTLAPEHAMVARVVTPDQRAEVDAYVTAARRKTDIERSDLTREKDGVFTGAYAINPVTHDPIPIWVADYVLGGYGTGAIMGVPAHDERDFAFARAYGVPLKVVVQPLDPQSGGEKPALRLDAETMTEAWSGEGTMVDSPPFDGTPAPEGIPQVIAWLAERGIGRAKVQFRLRDWLISRQRYWGCPIPMIHCQRECGVVPVPEEQLPIELPAHVESFIPTGRSPLEDVPEFINTTCPQCGGPAKRDPDTMDTFVDSSWYMLRYVDANNDSEPFSRERAKEWLPIDLYIGGDEHATGHLLYFRFFTKVLFDAGWLPVEEPVSRLVHQGMVADAQGETMSKSKGNVVSPGDLFARDGVDVPRLAMLFFAPSDAEILWSEAGIEGTRRFVYRLWETMIGDHRRPALRGHGGSRRRHRPQRTVERRARGLAPRPPRARAHDAGLRARPRLQYRRRPLHGVDQRRAPCRRAGGVERRRLPVARRRRAHRGAGDRAAGAAPRRGAMATRRRRGQRLPRRLAAGRRRRPAPRNRRGAGAGQRQAAQPHLHGAGCQQGRDGAGGARRRQGARAARRQAAAARDRGARPARQRRRVAALSPAAAGRTRRGHPRPGR